MIERWLRYVVLGGVFLLPLLPFVVADSMFFPFITGKNFAFRILTEIMFGAWVILALRDVRYRPGFSWILVALGLFVAVIGLADLLGENVFKSIWSNFERMEGWVTILHLLMYFLAVGSVLTTTKLWGWLAHVSVGASTLVSLYGVGQLMGIFQIHQSDVRLDATIGNSAYLAIYLVFHIFITFVLMARFRGSTWARSLYLVPIALQTFILYHTATRGAILGFLGGMLLAALLIALFERERKVLRRAAIIGVLAVLVLAGGFFAVKDAAFVTESPVLSRFASISFTESTTLSRFVVWNMAVEGAKEHPILGYGQENFNLVFNEKFRPELYGHEQWFDRVHNIVLDWLIAGGVLGLIAYVLIPIALLWYLWHPKNRVHFSAAERGLWTGLVAAYEFHNLFVFDNILSYILFISVLAYMHAKVSTPPGDAHWMSSELGGGVLRTVMPIVIVLTIASVYVFNWEGIATAHSLARGLSAADPSARIAAYDRAVSYDGLGRQEAAEQAVRSAVQFTRDENISSEHRQELFAIAERAMLREIDRAPDDARLRVFIASLYDNYGLFERAREEYDVALTLSPAKQGIWHQAAFNRLRANQSGEALAFFKKAFELDTSFDEPRVFYAVGALRAGDVVLANELLSGVSEQSAVTDNDILLSTYIELKRYDQARDIFAARVADDPNNAQLRLSLAAVYVELGQGARAIEELERVIELRPDFEPQARSLIEEIRAGRNPLEAGN